MPIPCRERQRLTEIYLAAIRPVMQGEKDEFYAAGEVGGNQVEVAVRRQPETNTPIIVYRMNGQPTTRAALRQMAFQADL